MKQPVAYSALNMYKLFLFLCITLFTSTLQGQSTTASSAKTVEMSQWEKATQGLDYSKDVPQARKPERNFQADDLPQWGAGWEVFGKIAQILAIVLAFLAISYGIYRMVQTPGNKSIAQDGVEITLDNLEDYLHESDLDRFLREAKAKGAFGLAIRLYYLQIIRKLSEKKIVQWARDKTNRDYVLELQRHPQQSAFKMATKTYEKVWYGNQTLHLSEFEAIEAEFQQLRDKI